MDEPTWKPVWADDPTRPIRLLPPPTPPGPRPLPPPTAAPPPPPAPPPRRRFRPRTSFVAALLLAVVFGVGAALAIRATQSDDDTSSRSTPRGSTPDAAAPGTAGAATSDTIAPTSALPDYQVGQCLGLDAGAGVPAAVVACDTALAFDLVTATADGATITCPSPLHGGSVTSHTLRFGNAAFSWCVAPPPAKDGFFQLGTCFQHVKSGSAVTFIERSCDDVLATHRIIGEATAQDCSAVTGATATISKSKAEGAGYWCADALP